MAEEAEQKPDLTITEAERDASNAAFRHRSGTIASSNGFVAFFYELMRVHLPAGTVEGLVDDIALMKAETAVFSNGYLAQHAVDIVWRLTAKTPSAKLLIEAADALEYMCESAHGENRAAWPSLVRHTITKLREATL